MALWEQILLGVGGLVLLFLFWPGVKQTMERSKQAEKDWPALIWPLAIVVLFVLLLIMLA